MTTTGSPRLSMPGRLGLLGFLAIALALGPFWPTLANADSESSADTPAVAEVSNAATPSKPKRLETKAAHTAAAVLADFVRPYPFNNQAFDFQPAEDIYWCAAFSSDGKRLATGSGHWTRTGFVRVWDVATRTLLHTFREPLGTRRVIFSPDGKRLASANFSRVGLVYDLETGEIVHRLTGHDRMLECCDWSPDGKLIATGSNDKTVRLWDAATGKLLRTINAHEDRVYYVRFSADSKTLLSASRDDWAKHWDVASGESLWATKLGGDCEYAVFSPDGETVLTGSWDQTVKLLDVQTGKEVATIGEGLGLVFCTEFSPDGKLIATGTTDGVIRLWDAKTHQQVKTLNGHTSNIYAAVFSPDGKTIASASWDNTARLWDVETGVGTALVPTLKKGHEPQVVLAVASPPRGELIASAHEDKTVRLWETATGDLLSVLRGHQDVASALAFSPDGKTLASGGYDEAVLLWDVTALTDPNRDDASEPEPRRKLTGHTNWIFALKFSPDGKTLASGGYDKTIRLWDAATGEPTRTLEGHTAAVRAVGFSPDGKTLASTGSDRTIRLWSLGDGTPLKTMRGHAAAVRDLAFSPDGRRVATGSEDKTAKVWDVATGEALHTLSHPGMVWSVAYSPDGQTVASAGLDDLFGSNDTSSAANNHIRLWDSQTGTLRDVLRGHTDAVAALVFQANGKALISGSYDKRVKRWPARVIAIPPIITLPDPTPAKKQVRPLVGFVADRLVLIEGPLVTSWNLATGERLPPKESRTQSLPTERLDAIRAAWAEESGEKTVRVSRRNIEARYGTDNAIRLSDGRTFTLTGLGRLTAIQPLPEQPGLVAVADDAGRLIVYDHSRGKRVSGYIGHDAGITSLALTDDGSLLASVDQNGMIRLWPTDLGSAGRWAGVWGPAWQSRQALRLQTLRDHLTIDGFQYDGSHPLTVEVIADAATMKRARIIGDLGPGGGVGLQMLDEKWAFSVRRKNGLRHAVSDEKIELNKPVHLAGVFDGQQVRLYVNGKRQKASPQLAGKFQPSAGPWMIGSAVSQKSDLVFDFKGRVQAVRISRTARYESDYEPPATFRPDADTLVLYSFAEGAGHRAYDGSGNGHHGLMNFARWVKAPPLVNEPQPDDEPKPAIPSVESLKNP